MKLNNYSESESLESIDISDCLNEQYDNIFVDSNNNIINNDKTKKNYNHNIIIILIIFIIFILILFVTSILFTITYVFNHNYL